MIYFYIDQIFRTLNLPKLPTNTPLEKVGFYAEIIFVLVSFLLVIDFIIRIFKRDFTSTNFTIFILFLTLTAGAIFLIFWQMPAIVDKAWPLLKPQM